LRPSKRLSCSSPPASCEPRIPQTTLFPGHDAPVSTRVVLAASALALALAGLSPEATSCHSASTNRLGSPRSGDPCARILPTVAPRETHRTRLPPAFGSWFRQRPGPPGLGCDRPVAERLPTRGVSKPPSAPPGTRALVRPDDDHHVDRGHRGRTLNRAARCGRPERRTTSQARGKATSGFVAATQLTTVLLCLISSVWCAVTTNPPDESDPSPAPKPAPATEREVNSRRSFKSLDTQSSRHLRDWAVHPCTARPALRDCFSATC